MKANGEMVWRTLKISKWFGKRLDPFPILLLPLLKVKSNASIPHPFYHLKLSPIAYFYDSFQLPKNSSLNPGLFCNHFMHSSNFKQPSNHVQPLFCPTLAFHYLHSFHLANILNHFANEPCLHPCLWKTICSLLHVCATLCKSSVRFQPF